ncbi:hypothetical protein Agabi119p4_5087 [Agaricus bisporus var. burnettii]|uniref:Uncharacterized protein n=1 Tax=Agaricus bisporus var. burnettii TaxID=192524 RepID=A0A8H7F4V0_AGABI|nr:hypothetical protein Agabi119p4_5087 [Agaricus bisporus var. burnettii]
MRSAMNDSSNNVFSVSETSSANNSDAELTGIPDEGYVFLSTSGSKMLKKFMSNCPPTPSLPSMKPEDLDRYYLLS